MLSFSMSNQDSVLLNWDHKTVPHQPSQKMVGYKAKATPN